ncbi:outer membrane protein assembly factor BamB family protein [Schlesneria paludicola]|uniref:outer membrane protein assembly factor BamB family protein n=1 Tax=Schlesneria paludicola TaxID=360056 RepID=UPI00029AB751|nr:PQQ-binding-like beta-propeller repeat protein [Schlesneria paludicola]
MTLELDRRICGWRTLLLIGCVVVIAPLSQSTPVQAQVLVAGEDDTPGENKPAQPPFLLPAQPTEIGEAMEDFRRFAGRKQWEKAFKHLEKVFAATAEGLVLTADGIMLPSRMIAREALLELPTAGQDAYRLFFDAEAKKLLEQAVGKEELTKLSQIFSRFVVTSVGDSAADKLGDLHFEAGNLEQAVNAWRTILEQRPDSQISKVRLRTKIGIALARQKHWTEFHELLKVVEQQHATEKVTIGGKEIPAVSHLRSLAERRAPQGAVAATNPSTTEAAQNRSAQNGIAGDIPLPTDTEPLWQFRFFPVSDSKSGAPVGLQLQNRWGGQQNASDWIPPVAADGSRIYVNFAGYDLGIDLENGKLLWRSGRIFDVVQKAQQGTITPLEQHGLVVGGGRVWTVAREASQQQQHGEAAKFGIVSRELDTGKKVFNSQQSNELKNWSIRGTPLISGERLYLAANKPNQGRDLEVLALNSSDGRLLWSTKIGSYTSESNPYSMERTYQPSLLLHGGHLYVDTHSGSLVQLDAVSGQVEWGLNYASEVSQSHRFWWNGNQSEPFTVGPPQIINGILYLKGMRSKKLYAVDPQRPRVLWHRSVPRIADLIGIDETRFYLGGEDISAFDLTTRKIIWSVKVNAGSTWAHPVLTQNRIYFFSSRGIYEINKADGKVVRVFRGADLESLGGNIIVTPKALLTVSNLAITAYPLNSESTKAKTDAASHSTLSPASVAVNSLDQD